MWAALLMTGLLLPRPAPPPPSRITEAQKIAIIQTLISEVGIARQNLPPDKKGVVLSANGQILNPDHVLQSLQEQGRAAKPGDRVAITAITFRDDSIEFAINGGPHKSHWYDHVAIGMGGTTSPVVTKQQVGAMGAEITLRYDHYVPGLTPAQVKQELNPLIDWDPPSEAEEMVKALPPPVKAAIAAHKVLVGMTPDMVVAAKGRTGNKTRETDASGQEYEDWVYGAPPEATEFVRIENGRVIRVTTYEADGKEVVEDKPDPALAAAAQRDQQRQAEMEQEAQQPAPTLRRPGDMPAAQHNGAAPPPMGQPPGLPPNDSPDGMPTQPGSGLPGAQPPGNGMPPTGPPTGPPVCCAAPH